MRIKKFVCNSCGAPKVNEYKTPYIVCDYCGSFTDVDYALGLDFWNAEPNTTGNYMVRKMEIMNSLTVLKYNNNREGYRAKQREYWDFYYKSFPAYIPPSLDSDEKYNTFLDISCKALTDMAFANTNEKQDHELARLQQCLRYYKSTSGETKVENSTFFNMAEFYINYVKESIKIYYENPEYSIMNELLPPDVNKKMKLSMFVQVWLPYLFDEDAKKFLKMSGFSLEYVDLDPPPKSSIKCEHCNADISVPEGSYKVFCEKCYKVTRVKMMFKCMSCGAENKVPDNPSKPVDCEYCGTENRLIQALFG